MKHFKLQFIIFLVIAPMMMAQGQPYPDRHTTNAFDGWISCDPSNNPNPAHGSSHWIMYDFSQTYALYDLQIWNMNHPDFLDDGLKNVIIEYSTNGSNWILADTFTIPKATSSGYYEGIFGPDLEGTSARFLLITALDNHGGGCYAMSEIRMYTQDVVQNEFNLAFSPCENDGIYKSIAGGMSLNGTFSGPGVMDNGDETFDFNPDLVGPGVYTIDYTHGGGVESTNITVFPCSDSHCPQCPDCVVDDTLEMHNNPISSDVYRGYTVLSGGTIPPSNDVTFFGNESIQFEPGFEVGLSGKLFASPRECDLNKVLNNGFENDDQDWNFYVNSSAQAGLSFNTLDPYEGNKCAQISVSQATGTGWHIQFYQVDHSVEINKQYRVSFAAKADGGGYMDFLVHLDQSPWTSYLSESILLTNNWQTYSFTFTATATIANNVRLTAQYGDFGGTYYLDKIKFVEE